LIVIVAANWKMNPPMEEAGSLAAAYAGAGFDGVTRILFPPHPYLVQMAMRLGQSGIRLGGQDCHSAVSGAHTGDVAAHMLAACGADIVLLGHSERRSDHGESDALVRAKAETALAENLSVMICVGETLAQRDAGQAEDIVGAQLSGSVPDDIDASRLIIAYEPVWAIGTGKVASDADIGAMHAYIHAQLAQRGLGDVPILYGGSVKPGNAGAIFAVPHVDGALVGGASLVADDFAAICDAAQAAI
jgi:triosephosphate isomerase